VAGGPEIQTSAAAERNKEPILQQLRLLMPGGGKVLEIASGTGQHAVHFAAAMPATTWQPSDCTTADFPSIVARRDAVLMRNVSDPVRLDVMDGSWPVADDFDAVVCINMIHISPWATTPALFAGASRHLRADSGMVVLYGPFREGGAHTAPSNETFEQWLKEKDPRFGVRNLEDVDAVARACGFTRTHLARLPANNMLLAYSR
jgi:cyclopropane fatty-acyl-phospholipid synthase-like methyltransferase